MTCLLSTHAATQSPSLNILNPIPPDGPTTSTNQSSIQGRLQQGYCTSSNRWNQPAWWQNDCQGVVEYLYHETMADGGWNGVEFMAADATRMKRLKRQRTPLRYIFRSWHSNFFLLATSPESPVYHNGSSYYHPSNPIQITTQSRDLSPTVVLTYIPRSRHLHPRYNHAP